MRASRLAAAVALLACAMLAAAGQAQPGLLGYFIRSMNESSYTRPLQPNSAPLAGATHYRLVPASFRRAWSTTLTDSPPSCRFASTRSS